MWTVLSIKNGSKSSFLRALLFPTFVNKSVEAPYHNISSKSLTPEITFLTNKTVESTLNLKSGPHLSTFASEGRPLSILLCWLMAKPGAVLKYSKFYLDQGFDVLKIQITPWQLLMPTRVEQMVQNEILSILMSSDHKEKLIHGFSVGAYVFARMLRHMQEEPAGKYDDLMRSLKGQIWDSFTDVNGISIGVSKSVFMDSPVLQKGLQRYVDFHLKAFYNVATKYYFSAHEGYYHNPLRVPALFFYSERDEISTFDNNEAVQKEWLKRGIHCTSKYWSDTGHVGHMRRYPQEYQLALKEFFRTTGILNKNQVDSVNINNIIIRDGGGCSPNSGRLGVSHAMSAKATKSSDVNIN